MDLKTHKKQKVDCYYIKNENDRKSTSFLIQRLGSKMTDIKFFFDLLPLDIDNVVEPFGGSFSVIRDVYFEDKYKKFVNDSDTELCYVYNYPEQLLDGFVYWNDIIARNEKGSKGAIMEFLNYKNINENVKQYILSTMVLKGYMMKPKPLTNSESDIKFMKKISFDNYDGFDYINKFKYNDRTFIFIDPPYLFSDNGSYQKQTIDNDNTDYYIKLLDLLKDINIKAYIMIIINDLKILRYLFKDYIRGDYLRVYQTGKKKMKHLIITNYIEKRLDR